MYDGIELAEEESLVDGAKDGSKEAWYAIYEANFPPIYRYVDGGTDTVTEEDGPGDIGSSGDCSDDQDGDQATNWAMRRRNLRSALLRQI